jgi:uncharacterized protein YndB with AHSA1/START domain
MSRFEAEATINRAPEEIWIYAADILRHPDWMTVATAEVLQGQAEHVGARGRERLLLGPFRWDVEFEVAEAEAARRLVWRAVDDPHFDVFEVGLTLEPAAGGATRATYHGAVGMRGRWRLLAPLIAMEGSAGVRRELARLKANVERAPVAAPVT